MGVGSKGSQFLNDVPGECDELFEVVSLKFRVFLVNLLDLVGCLPSEDQRAHVDEHGKTHRVDEFILVPPAGVGGLVGVEQYRVPNGQRVEQAKLSRVHAANPSEEEGLGPYILQFDYAEEVQIQGLQLVVLELYDPLQDGRVVLRVRIHLSPHLALEALLEHILLNRHHPLKHRKDVRLSMRQRVQKMEFLLCL